MFQILLFVAALLVYLVLFSWPRLDQREQAWKERYRAQWRERLRDDE